MYSLKGARYLVKICILVSIWLVGCSKNKIGIPVRSADQGKGNCRFRNEINTVESAQRLNKSDSTAALHGENLGWVHISSQVGIIYNRSYNSIQKGSYSYETYQVKHGDTLFYIAWITGNDYRDLAKKNKIPEPYSLHTGQILQVGNGTTLFSGKIPPKDSVTYNTNHSAYPKMGVPDSSLNIKLKKSNLCLNKRNESPENFSMKNIDKTSSVENTKAIAKIALPPDALQKTTSAARWSKNTGINDWRWPTDGKIIGRFSSSEGGNKGLDISGPRGLPICATAKGKVVYAGNALRGYGNLIIIKHNDDYLSAYAHNDTILVHEKQEVSAGQKIATMGSTGTSITRLHFEIRYKGKSVDPLHYISKK